MSFEQALYISKNQANSFQDRRFLAVAGVNMRAKVPPGIELDLSAEGLSRSDERKLVKITRQIERNASHFYAPGVEMSEWVAFDLEMGYGTSRYSELPNLDDVFLLVGTHDSNRLAEKADLLLCGSTEHLLRKTASAGYMGSGSGWMYNLIHEIEEMGKDGDMGVPPSLRDAVLSAAPRNRVNQIALSVFEVIAVHHQHYQRDKLRGYARVEFVVPEGRTHPRLVVATPIYIIYSPMSPMRPNVRRKLQKDLNRRYGIPLSRVRPPLPPEDQDRFYIPKHQRVSG